MARTGPSPSDRAEKFIIRLPDGMRDQLKASAAKNGRSMNAEIVERLAESLRRDSSSVDASDVPRMLDEVTEGVTNIEALLERVRRAIESGSVRRE